MSFAVRELYKDILDSDMSEEEKLDVLSDILINGRLTPRLRLVKEEGSDELECYFKSYNAEGQIEYAPTYFSSSEAVAACQQKIEPAYVRTHK